MAERCNRDSRPLVGFKEETAGYCSKCRADVVAFVAGRGTVGGGQTVSHATMQTVWASFITGRVGTSDQRTDANKLLLRLIPRVVPSASHSAGTWSGISAV